MAKRIKPPSARRIAEEAGEALLEKYEEEGLTVYRAEYPVGNSGNTIIEEGWLERTLLPNGKVLVQHKKLKNVSREWAEENE